MKRKIFAATMVTMLMVGVSFAQEPTIHDAGIIPTITDKEIIEQGQTHVPNRSVIVLDFEGLGNSDAIGQFYNDGLSGNGFGPGTDYGIYFGGTTLALIDADDGGTGNFANEPSPSTVMFFLSGGGATMNVPAGFTTGFSFYYTSSANGTVFVYDGVDGTGNLLASQPFTANFNLNCTGDPTGAFCNWDPVGVAFAGTAKSVLFTGVENQCAFDDVTFGSITPGGGDPPAVPLSNWALYLGIFLIVMFTAIRFRKTI